MKTVTNHERMELSWANNVHNTEFKVKNRLKHGFPYKSRNFCENNVLHTIFTITAFKAFQGHI